MWSQLKCVMTIMSTFICVFLIVLLKTVRATSDLVCVKMAAAIEMSETGQHQSFSPEVKRHCRNLRLITESIRLQMELQI